MLPNLLDDLLRAWDTRTGEPPLEGLSPTREPGNEAARQISDELADALPEDPSMAIDALLSSLLQTYDGAQSNKKPKPVTTAKFLAVSLGTKQFALPVESVVEAGRYPLTTFVPGLPSHIRGVFHLRGEVLPIVDLHRLAGESEPQAPAALRIVTLRSSDGTAQAAFTFDSLDGIVNLDPDSATAAGPEHPLATVLSGITTPPEPRHSGYALIAVDQLLAETGCVEEDREGTGNPA